MWRHILFLIFTVISSTSAMGQNMPRYDPAGWCKRMAEIAGGESSWLEKSCFAQEQAAYDKLKPMWGTVPTKTQRWCDQVARSGGRGSYTILEECVDMEFSSRKKGDNSKFKF